MTPTLAEALKALEALYEGATNGLRPMKQKDADAAMEILRAVIMRMEQQEKEAA